jgi:hypothetical protein
MPNEYLNLNSNEMNISKFWAHSPPNAVTITVASPKELEHNKFEFTHSNSEKKIEDDSI